MPRGSLTPRCGGRRLANGRGAGAGKSAAEQDAAYGPLHDRYAPAVEALTLSLKGFYLKSAQFISILDDFLPPQYMHFCKRTQDMVPSDVSPAQVRPAPLPVEAKARGVVPEVETVVESQPASWNSSFRLS